MFGVYSCPFVILSFEGTGIDGDVMAAEGRGFQTEGVEVAEFFNAFPWLVCLTKRCLTPYSLFESISGTHTFHAQVPRAF